MGDVHVVSFLFHKMKALPKLNRDVHFVDFYINGSKLGLMPSN